MKVCEACSIVKAQEKNIFKESNHVKLLIAGERLFMNMMTIKNTNGKVHKHWKVLAGKVKSIFNTKDEMVKQAFKKIQRLRSMTMR